MQIIARLNEITNTRLEILAAHLQVSMAEIVRYGLRYYDEIKTSRDYHPVRGDDRTRRSIYLSGDDYMLLHTISCRQKQSFNDTIIDAINLVYLDKEGTF